MSAFKEKKSQKQSMVNILNLELESRNRKTETKRETINPERSFYKSDFEDKAALIKKLRETLDEMEQGKHIKWTGKKPHVDLEKRAPIPKSSYQRAFDTFVTKEKLVEGAPKYPFYPQPFKGNSSYKVETQKVIEAQKYLNRRNIVITERKHVRPTTQPICVRTNQGIFTTEKSTIDSYVSETLINPKETGMLSVIRPTFEKRSASQIRNESSLRCEVKLNSSQYKTSYATTFQTPKRNELVKPIPYPNPHGW